MDIVYVKIIIQNLKKPTENGLSHWGAGQMGWNQSTACFPACASYLYSALVLQTVVIVCALCTELLFLMKKKIVRKYLNNIKPVIFKVLSVTDVPAHAWIQI